MIDALDPRPAKDDQRDAPQRRADALTAMAARIAADRATTPGSVAPVQAIITIGEDTWLALRRARARAEAAAAAVTADVAAGDAGPMPPGTPGAASPEPAKGSTADVVAALRGVAPVLDETGAAWPASEIARALCDCSLTRAVLDAKGQVLDLGSRQRFFQRSHWTALLAAGQRTCSLSGCTVPLAYTEMHHMAWWDRDAGPTSLANCAPECAFHHAEIHKNDIRVTRRPDGTYEHRWPDGRI